MFEWMNWKIYLGAAVFTALACFLIGIGAGDQAQQFLDTMRLQALNSGMADALTQIIFVPLEEAMSGNPIAALVAGVLWPLTLLWIIFMFLAMVFGALVPGIGAARGSIGG